MYQRLTELLLRWLRVPPEPHPPHGDPASLRVFRAGKNFLSLRLLKWGVAQVGAFVGIIFWLGVFSDLEIKAEEQRARNNRPQPAAAAPTQGNNAVERAANRLAAEAQALAAEHGKAEPQRQGGKRWRWRPIDSFYAWQYGTASFLARLPKPVLTLIWFVEIAGFLLYIVQLPVTFLLARMDYDLRWYMVTDRSLRIRHGIWKINESTMSFANIQQVVVSQGPLQRLLGLSDVKVQSAGGGGGAKEDEDAKDDDMHLGLFHSVTNPDEIRDLILDRLRRFRESGLGDPEEKSSPVMAPALVNDTESAELLSAARDLAAEARALRATVV
jgi:membrane protein YdbS with pleckstrin-like domain